MSVLNFINYYSKKENKEKLLTRLKSEGKYQRLTQTEGYIYTIKIGEVEGQEVSLEVSMKSGTLKILSVLKNGVIISSVENLQQASSQ